MLKDNITKSKKKQINGYRFFYKKKFFFLFTFSHIARKYHCSIFYGSSLCSTLFTKGPYKCYFLLAFRLFRFTICQRILYVCICFIWECCCSHSNSNLCFVLMANIISAGRVVYHSGFFTCSFGHTWFASCFNRLPPVLPQLPGKSNLITDYF